MNNSEWKKNWKQWVSAAQWIPVALGIVLGGCGKQGFIVSPSQVAQKAPGTYSIPPKVDILLVEDDTGSVLEIYSSLAQQIPQFLNNLQGKDWDYHFATIPLTTDRSLDQIMASQYDSNWGEKWIAPYPGASPNGPGTVLSSLFRFPSDYSDFLFPSATSNGSEPGLETLTSTFKNRLKGTSFLRDDALLVVFVVGNGQDTSRVNMCYRSDGGGNQFTAPCDLLNAPPCTSLDEAGAPGKTCASGQISFDYYKNQLLNISPTTHQMKFFAAVSPYTSTQCLGNGAYAGTRYMNMASALNGKSYNICTQSVSSILSDLSENLQSTKLAMRTRYLFVEQEPDSSTIRVTRNIGGDTKNSVVIPESESDGWTYVGYQTDIYAIDSPIPLNLASGYAIELHGSAKLVGDDTASVQFFPKGLVNAAPK